MFPWNKFRCSSCFASCWLDGNYDGKGNQGERKDVYLFMFMMVCIGSQWTNDQVYWFSDQDLCIILTRNKRRSAPSFTFLHSSRSSGSILLVVVVGSYWPGTKEDGKLYNGTPTVLQHHVARGQNISLPIKSLHLIWYLTNFHHCCFQIFFVQPFSRALWQSL